MESILGLVQTHGPTPPRTLTIATLLDTTQEGHIAKEGSWKSH